MATTAYVLKRDGQVVPTMRSPFRLPNGETAYVTDAEVGHAGKVYTWLPDYLVEQIDDGQHKDTWEKVEVPDPEEVRAVSAAGTAGPLASSGPSDEEIRAMDNEDLAKLAEQRGVEVEGTGAQGNKIKADYHRALGID